MIKSKYVKLILAYFTLLLIFPLSVLTIRSMGKQGNIGNGVPEFNEIYLLNELCPGSNLLTNDSDLSGLNPYFILNPGRMITLEGDYLRERQ